ncbi:putative phenol 2-monooxygenase [Arthrobacter globiformis NBRC 12137]|uniref:Putative phenol 2-monooxygenase n=1 Tax=Arthrobacter globiformis (strain ATCC 8010 / DSM 20124 / JCM 1332 / NBRC 12137 / NCIMB 8907 / NRRL B-2979 / 168) TaxID=1077972 RepID=H0QTB1_ARTG1|nr:FAD-dependent monooxygenase [Arthrobacter globiformis]GAB16062.1 putative phenol 2-monooxygenase [Arthrobacter globiformis NBRC 12137]
MTIRTIETDVLVVGAGPTGLTAALSLATQGVNAITISRYPGPAPTPRAHITNKRTMEVFRDLGVEAKVREAGYPLSWLHNNVFATTLAGKELARFKSYGASEERLSDYAAAGPLEPINCPQHKMEPVLLQGAREQGADVRYSQELVHLEQTAESVTARIQDRETKEEYIVRAQYVIAADGARSPIAEQLGFEFTGQAGLKGMATCWLGVDLTKYVEHRPGIIYSLSVPGLFGASGPGNINNVRPWDEWMFVFPWEDEELPSESLIMENARRAIGDPDIDIELKAVTRWYVNNVVATNYQNGRVFLAGDAAHRHPPYGGLGTNTAVQDAYNLSWKMAWVLQGKAGQGLLDSYTEERQPIGAQVVSRAIKSWRNSSNYVQALGLKEGQTADEALKAMNEIFDNTARGRERRKEFKEAVHLETYRANALGVELGQRYNSSAVVSDGTPAPEPSRDPELYYEPTTRPGAYLPHAWVEHDHTLVSTLDLVGHSRFSLVVGADGQAWEDAANTLSAELGIELPIIRIGLRAEYDDVYGTWTDLREIDDDGALLVRPDRHVAWRSHHAGEAPEETLRAALTQILALDNMAMTSSVSSFSGSTAGALAGRTDQ